MPLVSYELISKMNYYYDYNGRDNVFYFEPAPAITKEERVE